MADAFFAPVVSRIISYKVEAGEHEDYINLISNNKLYKEWQEDAIKNEQAMKEGLKVIKEFK